MRTLILAGVLIALAATPALACRGTAEYPEAADGIAQSTLTPERKKELLDQLNHCTGVTQQLIRALMTTQQLLGPGSAQGRDTDTAHGDAAVLTSAR